MPARVDLGKRRSRDIVLAPLSGRLIGDKSLLVDSSVLARNVTLTWTSPPKHLKSRGYIGLEHALR